MTDGLWLAYIAYLAWLGCGLCDFIAHWHTDLPHTSGLAESTAHLLQLVLLGAAVVLGLGFEVGRGSALLLLALVVAHAVVGYVDTRIAFAAPRVVSPFEQHVHSVLDMAPVVALGWLLAATWPAAVAGDWGLQPRRPVPVAMAWIAVLAPPLLLCVLPALIEFRSAWRARGSISSPGGR
jgi:hypothetical protein